MAKVIKVDIRNPFDPNATPEQWAEVGRRIQELAEAIDPNAGPLQWGKGEPPEGVRY